MSNPFDLSMYALVGVMAIIAVASTWYPKDRKINFYIFLLSIVTFWDWLFWDSLTGSLKAQLMGLLSAAYVLFSSA